MYKFNKILVGLDHTSGDKDLIKAASEMCELSGSSEIFFVNVIKEFNLPEKIKTQFPNLIDSALKDRKAEIDATVKKHFTCSSTATHTDILIEQESVTKSLLKIAAEEKVDLFILGRKKEKKAGVLVTRIARRAPCSLLVVPKGKKIRFEKVLAPTDFSNYAKSSLEKAIALARKTSGKSKIIVQNVYQVPAGYHYTGKSFEEFSTIMKENAASESQRWLSQFTTDGVEIEQLFSLDKNEDVISAVVKEAKDEKVDMIVIGAKGRTAAAALFIGSKAERLVQVNEEIPMLVIRPKGKGAGFLDYIKKL